MLNNIVQFFRKSISLFLLSVCLTSSSAHAYPSDSAFLAARDAYNARDMRKLGILAEGLTAHPLYVYILYWQISYQIKEVSPLIVHEFFTHYADTPLADRLRVEWLKEQGRQGNWDEFNSEYPRLINEDTEVTCYALQNALMKNEVDLSARAKAVWFTGKNSPLSCFTLFEQLITNGTLTNDDIWQRIRLALENKNIALAEYISQYLPEQNGVNSKTINAAEANPQKFLDRNKSYLGNRATREIFIHSLMRLARSDASLAAEYLKEVSDNLPNKDRLYSWAQIAYLGSLGHDPNALSWYAKVNDYQLSDLQAAWLVRSALRVQNWALVLSSIGQLSAKEQQESNWRYWKARALKNMGNTPAANEIFLTLSREAHFYGLLAGEEVGPMLSNPTQLWKPSADDVEQISKTPGIERALILNKLQMNVEALKEWNTATRRFSDRELLTAAEIASRKGWVDRAIYTADRTKELHDYSLRYPTPFKKLMEKSAEKYELDEAWVYGLIRQESRFIVEARSPVGAMGLMQLMPATAKWVANKLGVKNLRQTQISDINTNIEFGTFYLRTVLNNLGHPVLATAGYNAGPGRARRWRADYNLEGAIYAETIPITETRDYVKKVMTNATQYALQLGQTPIPLKMRLGLIPGKTTTQDNGINVDIGPGS